MQAHNLFTSTRGRTALLALFIMAASLLSAHGVLAGCSPLSQARPIYYLNPGPVDGCDDCLQDMDVDLHEYFSIRGSYPYFLAPSAIGDDCYDDGCHGWDVQEFYQIIGGAPSPYSLQNLNLDFPEFMTYLSQNALNNSIITLSIGSGPLTNLDPESFAAFNTGYDNGVLWVAAHGDAYWPCSSEEMDVLGDRVLSVKNLSQDGTGAIITDKMRPMETWPTNPNSCTVFAATKWDGNIACPSGATAPYDTFLSGHGGSGSYTTPMVASITAIASGIVNHRDGLTGGALVDRTLDYLMASCDRPANGNFQVYDNVPLTNRGPWSSAYGYGVISAWKAAIYALGYGDLVAADSQIFPVNNPAFILAGDFELRGDLRVPDQQFLVINPEIALQAVPIHPGEDLPEFGTGTDLQEVVIEGQLENNGSLTASLIISDTGNAVLAAGSNTTIPVDQTFFMAAGSFCHVASGAVLNILGDADISGTLVVDGDLYVNGLLIIHNGLTINSGASLAMGHDGILELHTDLVVNSGGVFELAHSTTVLAADTDQEQAGFNTAEVEIICHGRLISLGLDHQWVTFAALDSMSDWAGILLDGSDGSENSVQFTEVSQALVGIDLKGTNAFTNANLKLAAGDVGLRLTGRSMGDRIIDCEVSGMSVGIDLNSSSPFINKSFIHHNVTGLSCQSSSPAVRWTTLGTNAVAVRTMDRMAIPDLGHMNAYGFNNFAGEGHLNNYHIAARDPRIDIPACGNWWGTTLEKSIRRKILVLNMEQPAFGVEIWPILSEIPGQTEIRDKPEIALDFDLNKSAKTDNQLKFVPVMDKSVGGVQLAFNLPTEGTVSLVIYDISGRKIRELKNEGMSAGEHTVSWDGRDRSGRRSPSGVYLARLVSGSQAVSKKCGLVR